LYQTLEISASNAPKRQLLWWTGCKAFYPVSKKNQDTLAHNFAKCWQIFIFFTLGLSSRSPVIWATDIIGRQTNRATANWATHFGQLGDRSKLDHNWKCEWL